MLLIASPSGFEGEGKVKGAVVAILSCRWPLSLKSIYSAVTRQYALHVSYHAVHKALNQLAAKGVILKENNEYCLNLEWIEKIKCFTASLEKAYAKEQQPVLQTTLAGCGFSGRR